MRGLLQHPNRIIHNSHFKRKFSLEEEQGPEAGPFPSRQTDSLLDLRVLPGSLEPTVLSRIIPTYLQLFFEIMIFRNSIRNGTKFYYPGRKSHLMKSWKGLYKLRIRVSEKLKDRVGIVQYGESSEESWT